MESHTIVLFLNVLLSTEDFKGPYHKGNKQETVPYALKTDIKIFLHQDELRWMQVKNDAGRVDHRMPGSGYAQQNGNDFELLDASRKLVVTLRGFSFLGEAASTPRGQVIYNYFERAYDANPHSTIQWRGKGTWDEVSRNSPVVKRYLTSGWKFSSSGGAGGGLVISVGGGEIILTDPEGQTVTLFYGGLGGGAGFKKIPKLGKLKGGGSGAPTSALSTGFVLKNPIKVGSRELTRDDFVGTCYWVDAAVAAVLLGIGGAVFILNVDQSMILPMGSAMIPTIGQLGGVAAGAGIYAGWVKGAW